MIRMTSEICGRCDHRLASSNHHRDRLCATCQHDLGSYTAHPDSPGLREWRHARSPRVVRAGTANQAHPVIPSPVDLTTASVEFLVDAMRELIRRRLSEEIAQLVLALRGG